MDKREIMPTRRQDADYGEKYISNKFDPSKYYNCFDYYDISDINNIWKYAYEPGEILKDGEGNFYKIMLKKY